MDRIYGAALSAVFIAASVWPLVPDPPRDSFPFSNYPMFARKKGNPLVHRVVGFDSADVRVRIPPEAIANDEVMQAARTVYHAVRKGKAATARLCEESAVRVGKISGLEKVARLEVISARFDAVGYFTGQPDPKRSWRHARCKVTR